MMHNGRASPYRPDRANYFLSRRFTSSRTWGTMLARAVFSEGDAARPITASQPPGAHARLASITGQGWRGRSCFTTTATRAPGRSSLQSSSNSRFSPRTTTASKPRLAWQDIADAIADVYRRIRKALAEGSGVKAFNSRLEPVERAGNVECPPAALPKC